MNVTKWDEMTDNEKNDLIMQLSDWVHYQPRFESDVGGYWMRGQERLVHKYRPNFCNDLNAMNETEEWAKENYGEIFIISYPVQLGEVVEERCKEVGNFNLTYSIACPTASQRAEAFYLTMKELNDEGE